jgi:hypothetical protein
VPAHPPVSDLGGPLKERTVQTRWIALAGAAHLVEAVVAKGSAVRLDGAALRERKEFICGVAVIGEARLCSLGERGHSCYAGHPPSARR